MYQNRMRPLLTHDQSIVRISLSPCTLCAHIHCTYQFWLWLFHHQHQPAANLTLSTASRYCPIVPFVGCHHVLIGVDDTSGIKSRELGRPAGWCHCFWWHPSSNQPSLTVPWSMVAAISHPARPPSRLACSPHSPIPAHS